MDESSLEIITEMAEWVELHPSEGSQEGRHDMSLRSFVEGATSGITVTAIIRGFDCNEIPMISTPEKPNRLVKVGRTLVAVGDHMIGQEVLVLFEGGDIESAVILGVIKNCAKSRQGDPVPAGVVLNEHRRSLSLLDVEHSENSVEINASQKIVFRCGASSITLQADGRVIVRGDDVLIRSVGLNRIKGASVQIN